MKSVVTRIARKLCSELEDMILIYKAVKPFEKDDEAVKKLQKGSIPAYIRPNLQIVSRNDTVKIQACATNKVQSTSTLHYLTGCQTRRKEDKLKVQYTCCFRREEVSTNLAYIEEEPEAAKLMAAFRHLLP